MIHYSYHGPYRSHGGPQVAAACFAALIPAVLLLPLIRVTYDGQGSGNNTLFLFKPDGGFNPFAVILFFLPLIGILTEMMGRPTWDLTALGIAVLGMIMVPLAIVTASAGIHRMHGDIAQVTPAAGAYALFTAFATLAVATGIEAWRARHHHEHRTAHDTQDMHGVQPLR